MTSPALFVIISLRMTSLAIPPKHGGHRDGAGRPPELAANLVEARKLAKQLQGGVQSGYAALAVRYKELLESAIDDALAGDKRMKQFLLELGAKLTNNLRDADETPMDVLRKSMTEAKEIHLHQHVEADHEPRATRQDSRDADIVEGVVVTGAE